MTDLRTAAIQALEALWYYHATEFREDTPAGKAITTLQGALAEPVQEPVAWMDPQSGEVCRAHWLECHAPERDVDRFSCPLYTSPPQRKP